MKKNKITFFAMELILLVLALFFVWKIFIQNVPEKRYFRNPETRDGIL